MQRFDFNFCWNRLWLNNLQSRCCNNRKVPFCIYKRMANSSVAKSQTTLRLRFPFSTESFQNNHRQINFVQMLSVSWLKKIILRKTKSVSLTPSSSLSICTNSNIIKNASKEPYNLKC